MSIVVGTLTIDLKANTASFSQSMDKMSQLSAKTANDVKRSLEKIATAGAALAVGIVAATATLIETSVATIGSLNRLAQASGTTIDKFSALAYAAKVSHLEVDDMAKGMEKLAKSAFGAQNGNVALEKIFSRLGVSIKDSNGHLRDTSDLFTDVAVKFSQMGAGAGKTALAMLLFGKAGAGMIPMMNEFGVESASIIAEAKAFGLVIGGEVPAKMMAYHEAMVKLHSAQQGFGIQLTAAVLPALLKVIERLQELGSAVDIPRLAEAFGQKVTSAINAVGVALEFAVRHAHALKLAFEALAAVQVGKILIPLVGQLMTGGLAMAAKGVKEFAIGFAGLGKVIPVLVEFAGWLKTEAWMVGALAAEEGVATAASYGLATAVAAVGGPVTIAIAAVAGLVLLLYKFRESTFSLMGTTYQLRDVWNAAWIVMGNVFTWVGQRFSEVVTFIKGVWKGFIDLISSNIIVRVMTAMFGAAIEFARSVLGRLTPQFLIDALNQAKAQREASGKKAPAGSPDVAPAALPPPDTAGLGTEKKEKKDLYGDEIKKLDQLIAAQRAYLGVLDATPDKIAEVMAAEIAETRIVALNTQLLDEKRPALTEVEKATIRSKIATEESLKALNEYGKELVGQQHSTDLSIQQSKVMAAANLEGGEAVRQAAISNAMLALQYGRTTDQLKEMSPELNKLNALLTRKSNADVVEATNKEIDTLTDQIATLRISTDAAGQFVNVQREAALAVKLYAINQQLATTTDKEALAALERKRQLMIDVTKGEWAEADARAAIALRSPLEQFQEEINALGREEKALQTTQGSTLSYAQQAMAAARAQDAFNKATDQTVSLLLRSGSARDGFTAFFLDMQKQAKTTGQIIYEALNSAFTKLSDNLTELITGGKTNFGKMFQDIGKQMLNSQIKSSLQTGLGALGSKLGVDLGGLSKPDGTKANAFWVRMAEAAGLPGLPTGGGGGSSSGMSGLLGALLGVALPVAGALAGGGSMSPGAAYLVGENGPEIRRGNTISSNAESKRMLTASAGSTHYYSIDARGTDPVLTEQRTRAAILAAHNSAIGTAVAATADNVRRNPKR